MSVANYELSDSKTQKTIIYDIPTKETRKCWSVNIWRNDIALAGVCFDFLTNEEKVRAVLNFKHLDYETVFVEYPDIAPLLKGL
jgi:hypothetical protein